MKKIIFMATTKPYDDYNKNIQINAISSWANLCVKKQIIINSNDPDNKKYFNHKDIRVVPLKKQSKGGVPYVKDMFESGYDDYENGDVLCYINADMILQDDFVLTLKSIPIDTYSNFLIGGRRWSWKNKDEFLKIQTFPLDVDKVKKQGLMDSSCATDFFVHNKELYQGVIPEDMMIARCNWDMWLNATAIEKSGAMTIDITNTCFSVHPNHGYGDKKTSWENYIDTVMDEIKTNRNYERGYANIDAYKYYTIIENGNIVVKKR